jgi:hypothetical protein
MRVVGLLVVSGALGGVGGDTSGLAAEEPFPTFEPFVASRMWSIGFGEPGTLLSPDEMSTTLNRVIGEFDSVTKDLPPDSAAVAPELDAGINLADRGIWSMLPAAVMQLRPLWDRPDWSGDEIALANSVARLIATVDQRVEFRFQTGHDQANQISLGKLAEWFKAQTRQPNRYGYMIFTLDEGPWMGLDYSQRSSLTILDRQTIDGDFTLQLCQTVGEQWCLQGLQGGIVEWTKILTQVPGDEFMFTTDGPTALGPYGWKVHMTFGEYTHVYLDRDKRFLFYFTSW